MDFDTAPERNLGDSGIVKKSESKRHGARSQKESRSKSSLQFGVDPISKIYTFTKEVVGDNFGIYPQYWNINNKKVKVVIKHLNLSVKQIGFLIRNENVNNTPLFIIKVDHIVLHSNKKLFETEEIKDHFKSVQDDYFRKKLEVKKLPKYHLNFVDLELLSLYFPNEDLVDFTMRVFTSYIKEEVYPFITLDPLFNYMLSKSDSIENFVDRIYGMVYGLNYMVLTYESNMKKEDDYVESLETTEISAEDPESID